MRNLIYYESFPSEQRHLWTPMWRFFEKVLYLPSRCHGFAKIVPHCETRLACYDGLEASAAQRRLSGAYSKPRWSYQAHCFYGSLAFYPLEEAILPPCQNAEGARLLRPMRRRRQTFPLLFPPAVVPHQNRAGRVALLYFFDVLYTFVANVCVLSLAVLLLWCRPRAARPCLASVRISICSM